MYLMYPSLLTLFIKKINKKKLIGGGHKLKQIIKKKHPPKKIKMKQHAEKQKKVTLTTWEKFSTPR